MRLTTSIKSSVLGCALVGALWLSATDRDKPQGPEFSRSQLTPAIAGATTIEDGQIQLCQGYDSNGSSQIARPNVIPGINNGQFGYVAPATLHAAPTRSLQGVDQFTLGRKGAEAKWRDSTCVPWESMAYGEYIGPYRRPAMGEYRLRVNDELELVYLRTRQKSVKPYQLFVGDSIRISSAIDTSLNAESLVIRSDGMVSLSLIGQVMVAGKTVERLQQELDESYKAWVINPEMLVQLIKGETPLEDIINSVDARAGQGGTGRAATVSPDGTIQLPGLGSIPAIGLTLEEMGREINARYQGRQGGIEVTPILTQRAPSYIYVAGEVPTSGRFEMVGPTTVMQAIALAGGFKPGGNVREVVVFRRDQDWRLTATKLDLNGALLGKRPHPSDEIWLRDSDIVLIPKKPIQRVSEFVELYLTNTIYSIYPQQAIFDIDNNTGF